MLFVLVGVVELVADYLVCEEGKPLSPESARILVCFMFILLDYEVALLILGSLPGKDNFPP